MADSFPLPDRLRSMIETYLDGTIDDIDLRELEDQLKSDASARGYFARYSQMHTDLALEFVARNVGERSLKKIAELAFNSASTTSRRNILRPSVRWLVAASSAVGMVIGGGVVGLLASPAGPKTQLVAQPRTLALDFQSSRPATMADAAGLGTGFTHRLPGTGSALTANDPNWKLSPASGRFELTSTASDLNTRFRLEEAEFPGIRLSDLGFTGNEDFEVSVMLSDIPKMEFVGQFGVYAGTSSDWAIRGGLVSQRDPATYRHFVVNTRDGVDKDAYFVGLGNPGDEIRMQLGRTAGKFSMAVENLTTGATSTLAIRHPEFLDGQADIVAGVFACDPRGKDHTTVRFSRVSATVWVPNKK